MRAAFCASNLAPVDGSARRQPTAACSRHGRSERLDELWRTMTKGGVDTSRVAYLPERPGKGYGMVCRQRIMAGEDIVAVPERLGMSTSREGAQSDRAWYSRVAVSILENTTIYRAISDGVDTGGPLMLWPETDLKLLGCGLLEAIAMRFREKAHKSWAELGCPVSEDEWLRVNALALSRGFSIRGGKEAMLTPIIDMANHSRDSNEINASTFWDDAKRELRLVAKRQINVGEEVTVCYSMSPAILLNQYGITDDLHLETDPAFVDCTALWSMKSSEFAENLMARGLAMADVDGRISNWQPASRKLEQAVGDVGADYQDVLHQTLRDLLALDTSGSTSSCPVREKMARQFRVGQRVALRRLVDSLERVDQAAGRE